MFKKILYTVLLLLGSFLYGNGPEKIVSNKAAEIKLQRAEKILKTLVPDAENYHLVLSMRPSFGALALPPHVLSDKPTIVIFQGALASSRSDEEIAFMMAHEMGHLQLHHNEKMAMRMESLFNKSPSGFIALNVNIFQQKIEERQADLFGLSLYKSAGFDLAFFSKTLSLVKRNPNLHLGVSSKILAKPLGSLSLKNAHFNMVERFTLLDSLT